MSIRARRRASSAWLSGKTGLYRPQTSFYDTKKLPIATALPGAQPWGAVTLRVSRRLNTDIYLSPLAIPASLLTQKWGSKEGMIFRHLPGWQEFSTRGG